MSLPLERLYDLHAQALYAFLLDFTRNEADTRDALQDVFARLAKRPELLRDIRDHRPFLLRLAHNAAVDLFRRRSSRERTVAQLQPPSLFAPADDPDESAIREALSDALASLPAEQRVVAHLKLWEDQTFDQIATTLGISINTAASRYRYAMDKLRRQLRPIYDEVKQ